MAVGDAYVLPGFLTPVLTQLFFRKPPTTFLTYFCRGERLKYAGKKSRRNFDEDVGKFSKGLENAVGKGEIARDGQFLLFPQCFQKGRTADI